MDAHTLDESHDLAEEPRHRIERKDTGTRILLSILFAVIWSLVESLLAVIVVFALIWALVTQQQPPMRLREFSNRLVSYSYRIWRYLTHNEARVPFPFSELPDALEEPSELGADDASELHDEGEPPPRGA